MRVEGVDVPAVAARQLVEPDVRALGHEHEPGHPGRVDAERLGLLRRSAEATVRGPGRPPATVTAAEPAVQGELLLGEDADGDVEAVDERQPGPRPAGPPSAQRM